MIAAIVGLAMAIAALLFDRQLGFAGGVLIAAAIAVEVVALVLLARDRRETARALATAKPTTTRRHPF